MGGSVAVIIRYACNYADGRTARGEIEFDPSGTATITRADDEYIRDALDAALNAALEYETGEYRDGALASVPVHAEPGTPEHARGMVNPRILMERGIGVVQIEDPF